MSTVTRSTRLATTGIAALVFPLMLLASVPPEEEESLDEVVTTGMRISPS